MLSWRQWYKAYPDGFRPWHPLAKVVIYNHYDVKFNFNYIFCLSEMTSWLWQRCSGIALLILLFIHLSVTHLRPLSYKNIQMRLSSPVWIVLDLFLLGFTISHALNGLWQIGQEYISNKAFRKILPFCLWLVGCFLFLIGLLILFR